MRCEGSRPEDRCAGIGDEAAESITDQIAAIRALGWQRIELRDIGGKALADLGDAQVTDVADELRDTGLSVVCLASRIGNWGRPVTAPFEHDLAELETLLDRCAVLNCRRVRVMSYPNDGLPPDEWAARVLDRLTRLARRAERAGVILVHENCAGWAGEDPARMLRLVEQVASPALRLLFDMGNGVPYGYDAYAVLERILPHVEHVHVKDARRTPDGVRYVLPGEGEARVTDCLELLVRSGYPGTFSLEPHLAVRPHTGLYAYEDAADRFVSAGRRLHELVAECGAETVAHPQPQPQPQPQPHGALR
ncbi:sugar phosphate isomerase/epimerase [Streptomyces sp. V3I7]|uniref:sugar phosphate isomerase/epimerase family protein n=1 Tax=Streptomyces sp. V3I7 TaxID=3042278 RepID=UPI0027863223|nr:sugar phosphate isomerase/epimerase family protein [Streptomyces sp. V3I7]MDQ0994387.1 sugar phosphate isomerase/epimerase [Streptomyces sp. V3I7]